MRGFKKWMDAHSKKDLTGFFTIGERELTDREVRLAVNYAVKKGYETDQDIPDEELERVFKEDKVVQNQPTFFT